MNTASKLIAISLAVFAITAQMAQAKTAAELKTTIENYGLTATLVPNDGGGNPSAVTVTGTKSGAQSPLELNIDAFVTVFWQAELSGTVGNDGPIVGPAEPSPLCLVCIAGPGTFNVQSGLIINNGTAGSAIFNISDGTVNINGGTVTAANASILNTVINNQSTGILNLSGTPTINGRIQVMKGNPIRVDAAFAPPSGKKYTLHYNGYEIGMVAVKGGGNFINNFDFSNITVSFTPVASGNDIIIQSASSSSSSAPSSSSNAPSSSSSKPSSSSNAPSSSSISSSSSGTTPIFYNRENPKIGIQAKGMYITLENLPKNSKVEIYNLQGKKIYSSIPGNPSILRILVQTKGVYIVKITPPSTP